jgi:hypothetical protein
VREFADAIKMSADTQLKNPPTISGNTDANNCVSIGGQNVCLGTVG